MRISKRVETRLSDLEAVQTNGEFLKNVAEMESWFQDCQQKYNSPEEKERRRIEYERLLAEGEKLKAEVYERMGK